MLDNWNIANSGDCSFDQKLKKKTFWPWCNSFSFRGLFWVMINFSKIGYKQVEWEKVKYQHGQKVKNHKPLPRAFDSVRNLPKNVYASIYLKHTQESVLTHNTPNTLTTAVRKCYKIHLISNGSSFNDLNKVVIAPLPSCWDNRTALYTWLSQSCPHYLPFVQNAAARLTGTRRSEHQTPGCRFYSLAASQIRKWFKKFCLFWLLPITISQSF